MHVSAQVRPDYAARSQYAKKNRRPPEDERAQQVDERLEAERGEGNARQDSEPGFDDDDETLEYSRPMPSSGPLRRNMIAESASPPSAASTGTLWSLIGALKAEVVSGAVSPAKRQSPPATSLYDLLDQVIAHP